jgi:hypothetical protein
VQVLKEAQPVVGHGQAAQAKGGAVQHGPHQGQAAGFAMGPMTLMRRRVSPEVALDEVGLPDTVLVLGEEPQASGELLAVGEQAFHCRRVGRGVPIGHLGDAVIDQLGEPRRAGRGGQVLGVEDLPVGILAPSR